MNNKHMDGMDKGSRAEPKVGQLSRQIAVMVDVLGAIYPPMSEPIADLVGIPHWGPSPEVGSQPRYQVTQDREKLFGAENFEAKADIAEHASCSERAHPGGEFGGLTAMWDDWWGRCGAFAEYAAIVDPIRANNNPGW